MNLHPPISTTLRRPAAWPAWPRRGGTVEAASQRAKSRSSDHHLDWPLLAFWVGYLVLFSGSVWLLLP